MHRNHVIQFFDVKKQNSIDFNLLKKSNFQSEAFFFNEIAPPLAEQFCFQSWQTGSAGFYFWSRLSTQPFKVFRGFLPNSSKSGFGSLRKTPHGRHSTYSPRSHKRTIGLKTQNSKHNLNDIKITNKLILNADE